MAEKISFTLEIVGTDKQIAALNKVEKELKEITKERNLLLKAQEKGKKLTAEETKKLNELTKSQIRDRQEKTRLTKATKDNIRASEALKGSYVEISARLSVNEAKWKRLSQAERENTNAGRKLTENIKKQQAALARLDGQIGKSGRNVGKYTEALKSSAGALIGGLGVVAGVMAFTRVLKSSFNIIAQFGKAQATVAATLGLTREGIAELTQSSIDYGKTTKFTAVEVSGLQNELAKLGFTMGEIQLQTKAVLQLAEATGADLAAAAKTAGVALKAFGLSAIEAGRVASVLAIATTKSALSFVDYETILSTVGPVADAYGFSLEDIIALSGKLKDAGFDASKSSTALRNILLNLADSGGILAKELGGGVDTIDELIPALAELRDRGVNLNDTLELTDKRSVAAFNTLLNGAEDVIVLRDSLIDVNDELEEMVKTKTDNTIDAMLRLGSAWDGVVLTFRESEGFFTGFFDGLAGILNTFTDKYAKSSDKALALVTFGIFDFAEKGIKARKQMLDEISKMDAVDLDLYIQDNIFRAEAGDKFAKDSIKRAEDRLLAIREAEKTAAERKIISDNKVLKTAQDLQDKQALEKRIAEADILRAEEESTEKAQEQIQTDLDIVLDAEEKKQEAFRKTRLAKFGGEEVEFGEEDEEFIPDEDPEAVKARELQAFIIGLFAETTEANKSELDQRLEDLDSALADGLISEAQYAVTRQQLVSDFGTAREKIEEIIGKNTLKIAETTLNATLAVADRDSAAFKIAATGKAIIGIAAGIINALGPSSGPAWVGIAMASIIGGIGAINLAKIAGVEFEEGGLIEGKSHSQGGVPFSIGGQGGFEAEGGEVMFSNKAADYWGRSRLLEMNMQGNRFESGGFVANTSQRTQELSDESVDRLINGINNKQVINDPVEALEAQNEAIFIEQNGDI